MPTVFLGLAQYSHYSDVLRGRLIRALAPHYRVVVLTPLVDQAIAERDRYFQHPNVIYEQLGLAHPKLWAICDKYLRVPLTRDLDHLTYMRYFYRRPHWWPRHLLMRARILFPRWLFSADHLTRWEVRLARPSAAFLELVRRSRPAILITATPGFTPFEAELIIFAKRLGLPTAAVNINYDNLTSNGKLLRRTDYLAVWNEPMAAEARALHGFSARALAVVGSLRFDHYFTDRDDPALLSREAFLRSKGLDPSRKTVVWAGPTPANYPPRLEFLSELLRLRREGAIRSNPNILVRLHPNDPHTPYREFSVEPCLAIERAGRQTRSDAAGGQKIEMGADDFLNLTATLTHADVVLNFASTMIIEACIFDTPVINVAFPADRSIVYQYEYNQGLIATGGVKTAYSPSELAALVNRYLEQPEFERAERKQLLDTYLPFRDGKSYLRTAQFIATIARRRA